MLQYQTSGHALKRNHCNALPRYIIAYDSETQPFSYDGSNERRSHKFRLGVATTARMVGTRPIGKKTHRIGNRENFWALLNQFTAVNYTTWVIAHNILFDMIVTGLPEKFEQSQLVVEWPRSKRTREDNNCDNAHCRTLCVLDSPPTIIAAKYVPTGGRIVFVDTLNYFPVTLADLGRAVGIPKMDMPNFSASDSDWYRYCENDCEILFRAFTELIHWVKDKDMGMFRYTAPSQAMSAYRHRFMQSQILIHDNQQAKTLERRGYFGGRTEVFRIGQVDKIVHQYDVNSLFPYVMQYGMFPCKLQYIVTREQYEVDNMPEDPRSTLAEVEIETNSPIYPLRTEEKIVYPIGRFRTVLCGAELQHAFSHHDIRSVRSFCVYQLDVLFQRWVDELWLLRKGYKSDGNYLYAEFAKRLMNSLYGKFGQRSSQWQNVPKRIAAIPWSQWTERDLITGDRTCYRSFGWTVQRMTNREEIDGTFVAISAFITSAARMYMNLLRWIAGSSNVYYQGVDSLVVTTEGREYLERAGRIDNDTLGLLRHEITTNNGEIVGCNDYLLGTKLVISGRAFDHRQLDGGQIKQRAFYAASRMFNGTAMDSVTEDWRTWSRSGQYKKGTVQPDGWVDPLVISTPDSGSTGG
jgi:hypothetical protein